MIIKSINLQIRENKEDVDNKSILTGQPDKASSVVYIDGKTYLSFSLVLNLCKISLKI